ncbi:WXG100 family type VII secretion target [Streptomyces sp. NPDC053427]|uniref:WXG100 family type VII secretion target n=1 Tax=Streptomyces sp. NPDC053427 TaxID=3365701 RepID=UPI0037D72811
MTAATLASGGAGNAYAWAHKPDHRAFPEVPKAESPDRSGISGAVDEAVEWTLEKTGALEWLEKVTGAPEALSQAAEAWHSRAKDMRQVGDELRSGAVTLSEHWHGRASDHFGAHMGHIVGAIDDTAVDMAETAKILGEAAKECALAEETVIHLITELIEMLIAELATSFILDLFTAGLATVVDALISDAEVTVYIERIAKVSEELADVLTKLQKAIKEMKEAVRAGKGVKEIMSKARQVRRLSRTFRETTEGLSGERGIQEGLSDGQRRAIGATNKLTEKALKEGEKAVGFEHDWKAPLKEYAKSEGRTLLEGDEPPKPYEVDRNSIEGTFG